MTESVGELAGCHRAATSVQRHEDVAPVLVRQRTEDGLELIELSEPAGACGQSVSLMLKCGNAMPGPIARFSTIVSIFSQSAPIFGC